MRENRTYGSEGGESGKPDFPTPIERAVGNPPDAGGTPAVRRATAKPSSRRKAGTRAPSSARRQSGVSPLLNGVFNSETVNAGREV
jgi:hypothetical protein